MKKKSVSKLPQNYTSLLTTIKQRIQNAQVRTALAGNVSMLMLYWDVGNLLVVRQTKEGWGASVLPRLAIDLRDELPEVKGFSVRNLMLMTQFAREYPEFHAIAQPSVALLEDHASDDSNKPSRSANRPLPVAQLPAEGTDAAIWQRAVAQLPWAHNIILIQKVKDLPTRLWYAQAAFEHGWSRDVLALQIDSQAHKRQGKAVTNFQRTLLSPQSDLAAQLLKDPYIFDFLTLEKPFHERELETGLLRHLQEFLVELGTGFAFVGRQVHMDVGDDDFYIDLLFYHLHLRCFIVIDLKVGKFKAEYAGKMNFYLNAVDDRMKHESDQPSIGLILCEDKNKIVAEYALRGMEKSIGVSAYELTRALPKKLQSALPSIEQLEAELSPTRSSKPAATAKKKPTKSSRRRKSE